MYEGDRSTNLADRSVFFCLRDGSCQCGSGFDRPRLHFDSISHDGSLYFADSWFDIDSKSGAVLPFLINFDNTRDAVSPYLGRAWRIGLFESHTYLSDENHAVVIMPDGYKFIFVREKGEFFRGNQGWLGKVDGDLFRISAHCGDTSITFKKGMIHKVSFGGSEIVLRRNSRNMVKDVYSEKERAVLLTSNYTQNGGFVGLAYGDEEITVTKEVVVPEHLSPEGLLLRPLVPTISRVELKKQKTYREYSLVEGDKTSKLTVQTPYGIYRDFHWDSKTKEVKFDGFWNYETDSVGKGFGIKRWSDRGEEYFYENKSEAYTVSKKSDGGLIKTHYFPRGKLRNLVRKMEEKVGEEWKIILRKSYDEKGVLLREIDYKANKVTTNMMLSGDEGRRLEEVRSKSDNKLISSIKFNDKDKPIVAKLIGRGLELIYHYDKNGTLVRKEVKKMD